MHVCGIVGCFFFFFRMTWSAPLFLQSRALRTLGYLLPFLLWRGEDVSQSLQVLVSAMDSQNSIPIKFSACKSLAELLEHKSAESLLGDLAPAVVSGAASLFISLAGEENSGDGDASALQLSLLPIHAGLSMNSSLLLCGGEKLLENFASAAVHAWSLNSTNSLFCMDLFEVLALSFRDPNSRPIILRAFRPVLESLLVVPDHHRAWTDDQLIPVFERVRAGDMKADPFGNLNEDQSRQDQLLEVIA